MSPISTVAVAGRTSEGGADALTAGDGVVGCSVSVGADVGVGGDVAVAASGVTVDAVGGVAGAEAEAQAVTIAIIVNSATRRASLITIVYA